MSIIYTSTKTLPYVYKLTHPITGEFYFGFRCGNKVPSSEDLGIVYKTSSKIVSMRFNEFEYYVIAEFFDKNEAFWFEQELIRENFRNPLILNIIYQRKDKTFKYNHRISSGPYTPVYKCSVCGIWFDCTERNKTCSDNCLKIIKSNTGKQNAWAFNLSSSRKKANDTKRGKTIIWSEERKKKFNERMSGDNNPSKRQEVKELISQKSRGRKLPPQSDELRIKRSEFAIKKGYGKWMTGKKWYNNGIEEILLNQNDEIPNGFQKGKIPIICEKCGYKSGRANFKRYHNDDCTINESPKKGKCHTKTL